MAQSDGSLFEELKARGVSRREFLGFCASAATVLALPKALAARIAEAVESAEKPTLVWLEFQDCAGNTESFLRAGRPTVAQIILDTLSIDYHETIMAAAGHQAESNLANAVASKRGQYIAVVEGSIPTGADGAYCTIGGKAALQIAREVCGGAAATIAIGTCATFGGLPAAAPNPTAALGVGDAVPGVKNLINLSACPANVDNLTALIVYYLTFKQLAAARSLPPPSLRVRQVDPRQLRTPRALRCRAVRRDLGRRRPPPRLLPLQDGMQGAGDVPELSQHTLERRHELADWLRSPVHRMRRARLLGQDDAILSAPAGHSGLRHGVRYRSNRALGHGRASAPPSARTALWSSPDAGGGRSNAPEAKAEGPAQRGGGAMTHVVVDPVTRIEGHLRIEAEVDGGKVQDAWSSSTMFRGIELILQGRDPRDAWAFAQRICGVCTTVHAIASIRAVENAIGAEPPPNARLLRNLIIASQCVQDHVIHFYHLHALDWVDIVSALSADPAKTACPGAVDLRLATLQRDVLRGRARPRARPSSIAGSWGRSPTPTGATPPIGCRRRPT